MWGDGQMIILFDKIPILKAFAGHINLISLEIDKF